MPSDIDDAVLISDGGARLAKPIKVSQLVADLKADVEKKHRHVRVVGEISSYKIWRSGHAYFDIKDDRALLPAVMFKPHAQRVPFAVADGLLALLCGRVSIYPANSRLQMVVESIEPLGQGALALAFEQLKTRLRAEGLFEAQHKKPIKFFNQRVGIITSSHGAVLRDMVRILRARMPKVDIVFSPVRVQGSGAALEISSAISLLDRVGMCDVIIVGRGGGSLEDLWAFNEEVVAKAIFKARTAVISAVGHETDTTISDYVADQRAATPTHAASLAVPVFADLCADLRKSLLVLSRAHSARVQRMHLALANEKQKIKDPKLLLHRHWQQLDESSERLQDRMKIAHRTYTKGLISIKNCLAAHAPYKRLRLKKEALFLAASRLMKLDPRRRLASLGVEVDHLLSRLKVEIKARAQRDRQQFTESTAMLDALSPLKILARGFLVAESLKDGQVIKKVSQIKVNDDMRIRLQDGAIAVRVIKKE